MKHSKKTAAVLKNRRVSPVSRHYGCVTIFSLSLGWHFAWESWGTQLKYCGFALKYACPVAVIHRRRVVFPH
jgi:hypothetical protein